MEGGGAFLICERPAWFCRLHTLLGQQTIHLWQLLVGARSLPFLQHIGDVLSHSALQGIEHSGWDPIKHLGTGLSSKGLPRCLS